MEREFYCRTRRFERKVGDAEPYQVYWMAVATGNGFSVLEVTDSAQSPNLLMRFLPEGGESSIVETRSEVLGLEEALFLLDSKECEMAGRKNTSPVENGDTVGGWHYLSFADRHRVKFKTGLQTSHPDLYHSITMFSRSPITLEHLTLPINGPIFSNDKEGILLTPVYHSQFSDGWVVYARAVMAANLWQVQEVQRQITTGLPPSAPPVEKIRNLRGETGNFFSVIRALSDWEDVQALTPGTRFFGPEDLSEEQKQRLQMLALRGSYFRVAAERSSLVFDVFGKPHLSIRGLVKDEGVFPRLNPEKPEFPSLQRLLGYIESSEQQEDDAPPPPKEEDVLSSDGITKALAFYLDHFLVYSGLNKYKHDSGLGPDFWQATKAFLAKLGIELPHPQASPLMVAADFLTEQGNEFVRAAAREEEYRLQWRQRLESEQEVHLNRMGKVQSEIRELEARSKALAEKLAQQTSSLEELSRKTAEEKKELERLQKKKEFLKVDIRAEAIEEAHIIAQKREKDLRRAMIAFRDATLPPKEAGAEPFISLRLEFGKLNVGYVFLLCKAFADIPDEGVKVRIDIQKHQFEKSPEERLFKVYELTSLFSRIDARDSYGIIQKKLAEPEYGAVLWIEGKREAVANFVRAGGSLQDRLTQSFSLSDITLCSVDFPKYVKINEATYKMWFGPIVPHVPDALARVVRAYTPFSDSVIAARLTP
ncbi:MAG: hypothetical protein JNN09_08595 [Alphaproteobacteria bacterium]|nr:hypothetical protein [Alphaproteobacteria bacterium]